MNTTQPNRYIMIYCTYNGLKEYLNIWQLWLNTKIHLHPNINSHSQTGVSCSQLLRINSRSNAFVVLYIYSICNFLYKSLWMNHNSYGCMHGQLCTYMCTNYTLTYVLSVLYYYKFDQRTLVSYWCWHDYRTS